MKLAILICLILFVPNMIAFDIENRMKTLNYPEKHKESSIDLESAFRNCFDQIRLFALNEKLEDHEEILEFLNIHLDI
jgi:hypothetical protein